MTSYLIERGAFPFEAEVIRHAIGLKTSALDLLIKAGIGSICSLSVRPVTREVWEVTVDDDAGRFGTPISEPRISASDARPVRRVEYIADALAVAKARARVERWCLNQHDIALALAAERNAPAAELAQVA